MRKWIANTLLLGVFGSFAHEGVAKGPLEQGLQKAWIIGQLLATSGKEPAKIKERRNAHERSEIQYSTVSSTFLSEMVSLPILDNYIPQAVILPDGRALGFSYDLTQPGRIEVQAGFHYKSLPSLPSDLRREANGAFTDLAKNAALKLMSAKVPDPVIMACTGVPEDSLRFWRENGRPLPKVVEIIISVDPQDILVPQSPESSENGEREELGGQFNFQDGTMEQFFSIMLPPTPQDHSQTSDIVQTETSSLPQEPQAPPLDSSSPVELLQEPENPVAKEALRKIPKEKVPLSRPFTRSRQKLNRQLEKQKWQLGRVIN